MLEFGESLYELGPGVPTDLAGRQLDSIAVLRENEVRFGTLIRMESAE